jgi:hypothetical protein
MSEEPLKEVERVIEIHPDAKYVFQCAEWVKDSDLPVIEERLKEWWEDPDSNFLIIGSGFKIVRVDDPEVEALAINIEERLGGFTDD